MVGPGQSKLAQFFSGHVETHEEHRDDRLKTHYYKTTKDKIIQELIRIAKSNRRYEVIDESKERGEICINIHGRKLFYLVATVVMVRPLRTAVDFSITAKTGLGAGFGRKVIQSFYGQLAQSFEYIGTGEG